MGKGMGGDDCRPYVCGRFFFRNDILRLLDNVSAREGGIAGSGNSEGVGKSTIILAGRTSDGGGGERIVENTGDIGSEGGKVLAIELVAEFCRVNAGRS